ncbi:carbamoyltransferase HypF [Laceyella putida]
MAVKRVRKTKTKDRIRLNVRGIVQGVGYRPLVYRLAVSNRLTGYVRNRSGEVIIEVEGERENIESFINELVQKTIEPARINHLLVSHLSPVGDREFIIEESEHSQECSSVFPADLAVCEDCIAEVLDPNSRFHLYPFTSCTNCGPRYSIIRSLPYDRDGTSLTSFPLCQTCALDFSDPMNRRFHAQTIACAKCGPKMELLNSRGMQIAGNWLTETSTALSEGKILAVKGIGGFHLICDAAHMHAIEKLRNRKHRPRKPLALMARDLAVVEEYFEISSRERRILTSRQAPILLLKPKENARRHLPLEVIAPGLTRIGIMLAYTPLHRLLFGGRFDFIIATSGNKSGYPIARSNEEALSQLSEIADLFLVHNREIIIGIDDSVGHVMEGELCLIRRARGYVPELLTFPYPVQADEQKKEFKQFLFSSPIVLGTGGEMKNTFCFLYEDQALLSQHLGDMENLESLSNHRRALKHIEKMLGKTPQLIAYDPHPDYFFSKEANKGPGDVVPVYHHHAHMASCMAENGLISPVIGCILDGTGYGQDGRLWGFEILVGDYTAFERMVHLRPITLPGGESAIRHPWMTGMSLIYEAVQNGDQTIGWGKRLFPCTKEKLPIVLAQLDGRIPSPKVSSSGRLFDGIAAILGICMESSYEGEAAILLSEMIERLDQKVISNHRGTYYPFELKDGEWWIDRFIMQVLLDREQSISAEVINLKFHHTISEMVREGVLHAHKKTGIRSVVLSGGVWNNRYLLSCTKKLLQQEGFSVFTHKKIPAGDGGLAFGQAVSALWRWYQNHVPVGTCKDNRIGSASGKG